MAVNSPIAERSGGTPISPTSWRHFGLPGPGPSVSSVHPSSIPPAKPRLPSPPTRPSTAHRHGCARRPMPAASPTPMRSRIGSVSIDSWRWSTPPRQGRAPCVLASVGTALTLDALDGEGRHLGGWIAPGPLLMQQSVLGATVQVRPSQAGAVRDLADNTADGLASGCWQACAALVDRFVQRSAPLLGGKPTVTLGGGDADVLAPLLEREVELVPDAVLRGLAVWAKTHVQADNIP